ncbi:unnamed protein product, partial [Staurois parvus]
CFASAVPLLSSAFLAAISSAFLAAISSASWQQSHQLHLAAALVTEGCSHTWVSSDSQLTRSASFTILQNMAPLSSSCFLSTLFENSTS